MKKRLHAFLFLIFLVLSGCASQQDMDALKWEIDMLQTRLAKTEQGVNDLTKISPQIEKGEKESLQKQSVLSSQILEMQKRIDALPEKNGKSDQIMKQQADLNAQYTELYTQILTIQGKIEEIDSIYSKKQDDYLKQQLDIRAQYTDLSTQMLDIQKRMDELYTLYRGLNTSMANYEKKLVTDETNATKKQPNIEEEDSSLYELGLKNFEKRKFEKAINNFAEFLNGNPQQSLTDNAHFWIGECLFNLGRFEDAILEYDAVLKNFKDSEKIPDCLLKQGRAFIQLKDEQTGKIILQRLVNEFPNSNAANKAKAILK